MIDSDMMYVKRCETWNLIKAYFATLILLSRAAYHDPAKEQKFFSRVQSFIDEMEEEFSDAL